jgi:hypothetical protein
MQTPVAYRVAVAGSEGTTGARHTWPLQDLRLGCGFQDDVNMTP